MKIGMSAKVILLFLIAGLVPLGISGFVGIRTADKALKEQVEEYFSNIEKQVKVYSKDGTTLRIVL